MISPLDTQPTDIQISEAFEGVKEALREFSLPSFSDQLQVERYIERFGIRELCHALEKDRVNSAASALHKTVSGSEEKPFEPEYDDLCRLHWICMSRKTINVLEFGSGFSTAIIADAMRQLSQHFGVWAARNLRAEQPFHVYAVEEDRKFQQITIDRLADPLSNFATVSCSSVDLQMYDDHFSTVYSKIPNICPDFIYLDGPSQFATTQEVNGFSFCSQARMPMSSDILRLEFFLEPGTLILVDGRTSNARFLRSYLRRNWAYQHDTAGDVHLFELQEAPLGKLNGKKLNFCLDNKWLLC